MRRSAISGPVALGFVLAMASSVDATLIRYQFSGTVDRIGDDAHELDGIVQFGDSYAATWVIDVEAPDLDPAHAFSGKYEAASALLVTGQIEAGVLAGSLQVSNIFDGDRLSFGARSTAFIFGVDLHDPAGVALSSDALPSQVDVLAFSDRFLSVFSSFGLAKFSGSVDSVSIAVVPEPGMLSLVSLALAGAGIRQRRCT